VKTASILSHGFGGVGFIRDLTMTVRLIQASCRIPSIDFGEQTNSFPKTDDVSGGCTYSMHVKIVQQQMS
jgi:hypothetical protein